MTDTDLRHLHQALDAMRQAEGAKAAAELVWQCVERAAGPGDLHRIRPLTKTKGIGRQIGLEILAGVGWCIAEREER